jgi:hypothetical protein
MSDGFDAKLDRRNRNSWRGNHIEVNVTDDDQRVMRVVISREEAYRQGDPPTYQLRVVALTPEVGRVTFDSEVMEIGASSALMDPLALYRVARDVTDAASGAGTYAKLNGGNPDPKVQAVIAEHG